MSSRMPQFDEPERESKLSSERSHRTSKVGRLERVHQRIYESGCGSSMSPWRGRRATESSPDDSHGVGEP